MSAEAWTSAMRAEEPYSVKQAQRHGKMVIMVIMVTRIVGIGRAIIKTHYILILDRGHPHVSNLFAAKWKPKSELASARSNMKHAILKSVLITRCSS